MAVFAALLALALLPACAARAEGLWRCVGAQGETVFSSSRTGYRQCQRVQSGGVQTLAGPAAPTRRVPLLAGTPAKAESPAAPATAAPRRPPSAQVLRGTVYKVTLASGAVEYTNVRPLGIRAQRVDALFTYISTCYACGLHSAIDWHTVPLRLHVYADAINAAALRYGVAPALLRAIIHAESAFNPYAISDKGARGLMQLMPQTASAMGVNDVFDPTQNIAGGARYLARMLRDFGGNVRLATAAYNAGPAAVRKYGDQVPPYDETQLYVQRVGILAKRYARAEPALPGLAQNG